ncbi:hypothetical protein J6590_038497 [Homalodisca vitripennis]|nr:hypothetical protein J6590_038497 [Homalodisca vitripennis]
MSVLLAYKAEHKRSPSVGRNESKTPHPAGNPTPGPRSPGVGLMSREGCPVYCPRHCTVFSADSRAYNYTFHRLFVPRTPVLDTVVPGQTPSSERTCYLSHASVVLSQRVRFRQWLNAAQIGRRSETEERRAFLRNIKVVHSHLEPIVTLRYVDYCTLDCDARCWQTFRFVRHTREARGAHWYHRIASQDEATVGQARTGGSAAHSSLTCEALARDSPRPSQARIICSIRASSRQRVPLYARASLQFSTSLYQHHRIVYIFLGILAQS